jgi:hypothetical protein
MKALLACIVAASILLFAAKPIAAQAPAPREVAAEGGLEPSGFWDWIHKLSGPEYKGWGVSLSCAFPCKVWEPWRRIRAPEPGFRLRLSYSWYKADEDVTVNPAGANLTMKTIQLAGEQRVFGWFNEALRIEVGAGLAAHLFDGQHDSFWRGSFAPYLQGRGKLWILAPVVGGGIRVFQSFGDDAFEPLTINLERDGPEAVGFLFLKLGIRG